MMLVFPLTTYGVLHLLHTLSKQHLFLLWAGCSQAARASPTPYQDLGMPGNFLSTLPGHSP